MLFTCLLYRSTISNGSPAGGYNIRNILTENRDPAAYWRKLKQRLKEERNERVEQHTKTFHDRIIPISSKAAAVLQTIKSTQESDKWIFMRNGERMTTRQAAYILKLFADENGSKVKSSHKLRKTCGSNLFKNGASAQQCSDYLGNSIEIFQRNYCFDTQTDEAMRLIVESV